MVSLVGFLPPDDPRVLSTITPPKSGSLMIAGCSTATGLTTGSRGRKARSSVHLLVGPGAGPGWKPRARARTVFERAAAFINDVGLLAEEVDAASGELLGNFPKLSATLGWSTWPGPFQIELPRPGRRARPPARRIQLRPDGGRRQLLDPFPPMNSDASMPETTCSERHFA